MNSRPWKWTLIALLSAGLAAAVPLAAAAQTTPQSPMAQAHKEVAEARAQITKAKQALDRSRQNAEVLFGKANPGYATAQKNYEKAFLDLKNITTAAMASLQQKPEYIDAVKAKQAAKDKQTKLLAPESKASEEDRQNAFSDVVVKTQIVSDMESAVAQADPRIVDAKQRLADARQALDDFKAQIDVVCAADPEYKQAQQTETAAQQRLTQAEASLQQQTKQAAEAAAAAAKSHTPTTPRY